MSSMYAKLMSRITESSLMEEDVPVRYCFMMMLAIADPQGYVIGTDVAIARRMNIATADFKKYVAELMEPDPDSNSHEQDGRRVVVSDSERGYYVVNYRKYRDTRDEEQRRDYMRKYMQDRRAAEAVGKSAGKPSKTVRVSRKHRKPQLAKAEGEVKAEGEEDENTAGAEPACSVHQQFVNGWMGYYENRYGAKYAFQGARDGKAIKTLLAHFGTADKAKSFIGKCHAREGEGYPFTNTKTLSDLANGISNLQAALAIPPRSRANGHAARPPMPQPGEHF